jgi:outer membrane protein assembly factor BamB
VQAAPAGIFTAFGGAFDYLLVGTRNPLGSNNSLIAMNPFTGGIITYFLNGGAAADRIGAINAMPAVDYANNRVYFTSVQDPSGASSTLWALQLGSGPVFTEAWSPQRALGSLTSSPVLMGDRVYVGSLMGGGTIHSIDAKTGDALLDRSFLIADGEVKGFPFPDRASKDVWFATNHAIWGVRDDGISLSVRHGMGFSLDTGVTPTSPVLFIPGDHYVYVGGSDGRLYELDTLAPAMNSVQLGDGQSAVGAPSLDWETGLIHVGTEAGVFYAVEFPLP